ncbi:recombinase family protein [Synechocystis sp. LKSZ1]|uniref:recombinase family protein n=1 Tax=Synechocystis sp. LKSZ1 TaxID=3144951 RepID=UPI00336BC72D
MSESPPSPQRQGHQRRRHQGLPPPGKAPYGYRKSRERYLLDRAAAPVVKAFFDYFLRSGSLRGAVRYLEKRYSKKISPATGRRWLSHPIYRGDLLYGDQTVIANAHPAIVSRQEAAQIDRLLRSHRQYPRRSASAPHCLAGLVYCQQCTSRYVVSSVTRRGSDQRYLYLRPQACPNQQKCPGLTYSQVLNDLIQYICDQLPRAVATVERPRVAALRQQLQSEWEKRQRICEQLPALTQQGILDRDTEQRRHYQLQGEMAQLQQQINQLPPDDLPPMISAVGHPQFWHDLSEGERRFYLREFIQRIEIQPLGKSWQLTAQFCFAVPNGRPDLATAGETAPAGP